MNWNVNVENTAACFVFGVSFQDNCMSAEVEIHVKTRK